MDRILARIAAWQRPQPKTWQISAAAGTVGIALTLLLFLQGSKGAAQPASHEPAVELGMAAEDPFADISAEGPVSTENTLLAANGPARSRFADDDEVTFSTRPSTVPKAVAPQHIEPELQSEPSLDDEFRPLEESPEPTPVLEFPAEEAGPSLTFSAEPETPTEPEVATESELVAEPEVVQEQPEQPVLAAADAPVIKSSASRPEVRRNVDDGAFRSRFDDEPLRPAPKAKPKAKPEPVVEEVPESAPVEDFPAEPETQPELPAEQPVESEPVADEDPFVIDTRKKPTATVTESPALEEPLEAEPELKTEPMLDEEPVLDAEPVQPTLPAAEPAEPMQEMVETEAEEFEAPMKTEPEPVIIKSSNEQPAKTGGSNWKGRDDEFPMRRSPAANGVNSTTKIAVPPPVDEPSATTTESVPNPMRETVPAAAARRSFGDDEGSFRSSAPAKPTPVSQPVVPEPIEPAEPVEDPMEAPRAGTPPMATPVPNAEPEDAFIEPSTPAVSPKPEPVPTSRPSPPDYDAEPIRRPAVPAAEPMPPAVEEAPRERRPAAPRNEAEFVPRNRDGAHRGPDLKMEIKGPTQVALGGPVVLEFRISNVGNAPATGVVATDLLPEGLKHPVSPDLEYRIGQLAPGESRSTQLKLTADKAGRIVNRAQVTADGRLLNEASVEVQVVSNQVQSDRVASDRVQVEHTGPVRWYYGLSAYFTTELVNPGAEELRDVEVVQKLPAGVKFVEATQNGRYDRDSNTVTWKLASLSSRERRTLQATILPAGSGQHESTVAVRDAQGESGKGRWGVCVICPPTTGY